MPSDGGRLFSADWQSGLVMNSITTFRWLRPPSVCDPPKGMFIDYFCTKGGQIREILCALLGLHVYDIQGGRDKKIRKYANVFLGFHASTFSVSVKF